jgi:beta-galactosidase
VVLRVTDEFGAIRPFGADAIRLQISGPAEIVGDNPFSLVGGQGAIWIRALEVAGKAKLLAVHPTLGVQQVEFDITQAEPEIV